MVDQAAELARPTILALERILGVPFTVLNDGFVRVIDYMGSDESIVQAARVSYGQGTKRVQEDRGLIRYLMRHHHTTPFEMCELKLHVRVPMDCWRQWIRHRTANVNEYSTRYSVAIDSAQITPPSEWRIQSEANKQGSANALEHSVGIQLSSAEADFQRAARELYEKRLAAGVAREQARKDLPLSTYTEAYWKVDLHNLFHFLELRSDPYAQLEIRKYAEIIGDKIVSQWCPAAWSAFQDYRLQAVSLSRIEANVIRNVAAGNMEAALETARQEDFLGPQVGGPLKRNRERDELEAKLRNFGLPIPWAAIVK
jgi:thymidylate synthase (FAD)